jgi:hypothetical protein
MPFAQLRNLLQSRRQFRQVTGSTEALDRTELFVRGTTRAHEICVIGVGQPVRARSSRRHDGALLEEQDRSSRAGKREHACDRVDALRVCERVTTSLHDKELHSFLGSEPREELGALGLGTSKLQMRRARTAERTTAEQRPAQIGAAAAGACDDPPRRVGKGRQARAQDAGFVQNLERVLVAADMELVASRPIKSPPLVRADLGRDAEPSQQAEGTANDGGVGDVEVEGDLAATSQVDAARGVEQPRQFGEPVALAARRDRGELAAEVLRE